MLPATTYVLPAKLRTILNRPLGDLIRGSAVDLGSLLRSVIAERKPTKLIFVGDSVSRQATLAGIAPDVMIVDNLEKRKRAIAYAYPHDRIIAAKNRAGTIEENARLAVERAVRGEADLVIVDGEEDLLAVIAVISAPLGSLVVYGQPNEGVVLVRVSSESKVQAERILGQMDRES